MSRQAICVLGMHRSGTSTLIGSLEEAGVYLGEKNSDSPYNPKGNRENPAIMKLNEDVLTSCNGSWESPPRIVSWSDPLRRRRDEIIASYGSNRTWGFKCPRTLFTLDGWLEALPEMQVVGTYRHPLLVAQSLQRRNGGMIDRWLGIWNCYNRQLLSAQRRLRFPLVCFDLSAEAYDRVLRQACRRLGLGAPDRFDFFDESLRHAKPGFEGALPDSVALLYRDLCSVAEKA